MSQVSSSSKDPGIPTQPFVRKAPQFVVGRAYLHGLFPKQVTNGPKAVLLLRPQTGSRNKKVCQSFIERVSPVETLSALTDAKIVPTYWLLTEPVEQIRTGECKNLLEAYDFEQAQALYSIYGLTQDGPVILAVDPSNNFVIVDLSRASSKDMKKFMASWFTAMPADGTLTVTSITLWDRLREYACGIVRAGNTQLAKTQPDLTKPDSVIQVTAGVMKKVSWIGTGALLIGQTMGAAACPAAVSTTTKVSMT